MKTANSLKVNTELLCQFERLFENDSVKNVILCNISIFFFFFLGFEKPELVYYHSMFLKDFFSANPN